MSSGLRHDFNLCRLGGAFGFVLNTNLDSSNHSFRLPAPNSGEHNGFHADPLRNVFGGASSQTSATVFRPPSGVSGQAAYEGEGALGDGGRGSGRVIYGGMQHGRPSTAGAFEHAERQGQAQGYEGEWPSG